MPPPPTPPSGKINLPTRKNEGYSEKEKKKGKGEEWKERKERKERKEKKEEGKKEEGKKKRERKEGRKIDMFLLYPWSDSRGPAAQAAEAGEIFSEGDVE